MLRSAWLDVRVRFLVLVALWSAGLLVILRSPLGERAIVAPFAAWHAAMAYGVSGGSPVTVDLSCSGSDVIAMSMAAILAYPVAWRRRLTGLAVAALWLSALNLVRIITLVNTAGSPMFLPLHLYIWPGLMIAAASAFVFHWMWTGERARAGALDAAAVRRRRFVVVTGLLVVAYVALSPWLMRSVALQTAAVGFAGVAAAMLRMVGVEALTGGSTLVVGSWPFLITPECIVTPLMPVYLAWALTWPPRWRSRLGALAAFVPLFAALSILRLLTVALPAMIGPPLFLTHGFYQIVVGVLLILIAARWRTRGSEADVTARVFAAALGLAALTAVALARPYVWVVETVRASLTAVAPHSLSALPGAADVQGAVAIMPAYQLGLLIGLTVALFGARAWRIALALAPLAVIIQVVTLIAIGEGAFHGAREIPTVAIRAVAIAVPVLLAALAASRERGVTPAGPHA
jgi:exosortase/archaeosortase family protein